jgi:uncharacterized membrane protein
LTLKLIQPDAVVMVPILLPVLCGLATLVTMRRRYHLAWWRTGLTALIAGFALFLATPTLLRVSDAIEGSLGPTWTPIVGFLGLATLLFVTVFVWWRRPHPGDPSSADTT